MSVGTDYEPSLMDEQIDAYLDAYQQTVELGWPDDTHFNYEAWDLGIIDGIDRILGEYPQADQVESRLIWWSRQSTEPSA